MTVLIATLSRDDGPPTRIQEEWAPPPGDLIPAPTLAADDPFGATGHPFLPPEQHTTNGPLATDVLPLTPAAPSMLAAPPPTTTQPPPPKTTTTPPTTTPTPTP
ncbi:MAG: hypothetical protein ACT4NY_18920 [Pseudonocardiales bacterium]